MQLRFNHRHRPATVRSAPRRATIGRSALTLAALASALVLAPATAAQADPGVVHFRVGSTNCAVHDNGSFACGFAQPVNPPRATLQIVGIDIPVPFGVSQVSYGGQAIPTLPSFGPAGDYTLPGGNPDIAEVATAQGQWGPIVDYGGTHCEVSFHGSFSCSSHGHGFTSWSGNLSMN